MVRFRYVVTAAFECEAADSDEAYDKFQKMKLSEAYWDNTCDGVREIDEKEVECSS